MKNINKKIETMFNSNEKYKLFFLRKFLNNLRIGCKKEKFPLIENFQEDNLILKLKENECEGYLKIIIVSNAKGLDFFWMILKILFIFYASKTIKLITIFSSIL